MHPDDAINRVDQVIDIMKRVARDNRFSRDENRDYHARWKELNGELRRVPTAGVHIRHPNPYADLHEWLEFCQSSHMDDRARERYVDELYGGLRRTLARVPARSRSAEAPTAEVDPPPRPHARARRGPRFKAVLDTIRRFSFPGAFLASLAILQALGVTGMSTVSFSLVVGLVAYLAARVADRAKRSRLTIIGLVVTAIAALILGRPLVDDATRGATLRDAGPPIRDDTSAAAPSQRGTHTQTAAEPSRASAPPQPPLPRRAHVTFPQGPMTAKALGLTISIGEVDLAADGEDVVRRLIARIGSLRCPAVGSWRNVRTGDQLVVASRKRRFVVLVERIDLVGLPGELEATVSRSTRRWGAEGNCERS